MLQSFFCKNFRIWTKKWSKPLGRRLWSSSQIVVVVHIHYAESVVVAICPPANPHLLTKRVSNQVLGLDYNWSHHLINAQLYSKSTAPGWPKACCLQPCKPHARHTKVSKYISTSDRSSGASCLRQNGALLGLINSVSVEKILDFGSTWSKATGEHDQSIREALTWSCFSCIKLSLVHISCLIDKLRSIC